MALGGLVLVLIAAVLAFRAMGSASQATNPEIIEQKTPPPPDSFQEGKSATPGESSDRM